jgi:ATP/maltotriose-dependent transcriptional regulator MalT/DNA-binding SARP family transcriptional activator
MSPTELHPRSRPASFKLAAPRVPASALTRPGLDRRLDEVFGRRLTVLVAGAGYGKSTALAAWVSDVSHAWYTITGEDRVPTTLVRGLVQTVAQALGPLALPVAAVRPGAAVDEPGQAEALVALLAEALERRLEHDLVLVVDDVQELSPGGASARVLEGLCRQIPPSVHLVLASRVEPPFAIVRLRTRGEVLELGASALAFTTGELAALLDLELGERAGDLAGAVHEATGGWPAAVRLVVEALRGVPVADRTDVLGQLSRARGSAFADLAREAISREPEATRELLATVALFDLVDPELCTALGLPAAVEQLDSLSRRGLFLARHGHDSSTYTPHSLLREFARERLSLPPARRAELHARAAELFETRGALGAALTERVAAEDIPGVARLLAERGQEILALGDLAAIERAAVLVPEDDRDAAADLTVGQLHALRGRWEEALACYERAGGGDQELPAALAWRLGRIHFDRGDHAKALETYARGRYSGADGGDDALLLAWTASAYWGQGDLDECVRLAQQALNVAAAGREPLALAVAHYVLMLAALGGDAAAADLHFRSGLDAAERAGDPQLIVRLRANRASQLQQQGAYGEALEQLGAAIGLAEVAGGPGLAFPLLKRGEAYLYLGRLDEAVADFRAAESIYKRFGSLRVARALTDLGDVYLERGDLALARAVLEQAIELGREANDAPVLAYAQASLARVLALDDPERAATLAREAVAVARKTGFGLESVLLAAGWVALARGARAEAGRLAEEAAGRARTHLARPALAEALALAALAAPDPAAEAARLREAAEIFREIESPIAEAQAELALGTVTAGSAGRAACTRARRRLEAAGVRVRAAAGAAGVLASLPPEQAPPLAIRTLGAFAVLRDGQAVAISEWKSRKARDLLKILVARRGRPVPRDVFLELLWPGEEPEKLSNRLSVALSTLRAVLDPGGRFDPDEFVTGDRSAIRLELEHVAVDVEEFLNESAAALRLRAAGRLDEARSRLEYAESCYAGDFLEEDAYADWAVPLREEARAMYIGAARTLAGEAGPAGTRYLLRILERDPYDEEAHLSLVAVLATAGAHGEARRAYRRYVACMEEIGVEAVPFPAGSPGAGAPAS